MSIEILPVTRPEQLIEVERLRYEVYVDEKHLFVDRADHEERRLSDLADANAYLWLAMEDGRAIGTVRVLLVEEIGVDDELERNFSIQRFVDVVGAERLIIFGRFMILPEHRAGLASAMLLDAIARFAFSRGVDVGFCDCEPHLVAFYEAIGFRQYRGVFNDDEFGLKVPLVLLASDRAHLEAVNSFFVPLIPTTIGTNASDALLSLVRPAIGHESASSHAVSLLARASGTEHADDLPLLAGLDHDAIQLICRKAAALDFRDGDVLMKEGHASRTMWVLLEGTVEVVVGDDVLAVRTAGDVVGELAMLLDRRRSAEVRAVSNGRAIVLSDRSIERLLLEEPAIAARFFFNLAGHLGRRLSTERTI